MIDRPNIVLYPKEIIKTFSDPKCYEAELKVYNLNLPHVPLLLSHGKSEKIGESLWYISTQRIKASSYMDQLGFDSAHLGSAIADFHTASMEGHKCICHIDNQPKNIILCGTDYYFVDFSDSREDFPETDVSHLLLFWAEEYEYTDFVSIAAPFLDRYQDQIQLNHQLWTGCLQQSIKRFDKRLIRHRGMIPSVQSKRNRDWLHDIV